MKKDKKNPPISCYNVVCMKKKCKRLASHKVGEENIWDKTDQKEEYDQFNQRHNYTTYLCDKHFDKLMKRHYKCTDVEDDRYDPELLKQLGVVDEELINPKGRIKKE